MPYIPPHMRRSQESAEVTSLPTPEVPPPTLGASVQVQFIFSSNRPVDLGSCPAHVMHSSKKVISSTSSSMLLFLPLPTTYDEIHGLLRWFISAAGQPGPDQPDGDVRSCLVLPQGQGKKERARWDAISQRMGLSTVVMMVNERRRLRVGLTCYDEEKAALSDESLLPPVVSLNDLCLWCQMEGGQLAALTKKQLNELQRQGLPPVLVELTHQWDAARKLASALQAHDEEQALHLLASHPDIAKLRDPDTGGYPLHLAAFHGLAKVTRMLCTLSAPLEARDGRRMTAVQVAQSRGQQRLVSLLNEAGKVCIAGGNASKPQQSTPSTSWRRKCTHTLGASSHTSTADQPIPLSTSMPCLTSMPPMTSCHVAALSHDGCTSVPDNQQGYESDGGHSATSAGTSTSSGSGLYALLALDRMAEAEPESCTSELHSQSTSPPARLVALNPQAPSFQPSSLAPIACKSTAALPQPAGQGTCSTSRKHRRSTGETGQQAPKKRLEQAPSLPSSPLCLSTAAAAVHSSEGALYMSWASEEDKQMVLFGKKVPLTKGNARVIASRSVEQQQPSSRVRQAHARADAVSKW